MPMPGTHRGESGWYQSSDTVYYFSVGEDGEFNKRGEPLNELKWRQFVAQGLIQKNRPLLAAPDEHGEEKEAEEASYGFDAGSFHQTPGPGKDSHKKRQATGSSEKEQTEMERKRKLSKELEDKFDKLLNGTEILANEHAATVFFKELCNAAVEDWQEKVVRVDAQPTKPKFNKDALRYAVIKIQAVYRGNASRLAAFWVKHQQTEAPTAEAIVAHRLTKGSLELKINWHGREESNDEWLSVQSIRDQWPLLLEQYSARLHTINELLNGTKSPDDEHAVTVFLKELCNAAAEEHKEVADGQPTRRL